MRIFIIASSVIVSCISGTAVAQEHKAKAMTPEALQWAPAPPVLPKGGQMAVLAGDPGKKGQFFVVRLKAPAGYKIPAHQHPTAEAVTAFIYDRLRGLESEAGKLYPATAGLSPPVWIGAIVPCQKGFGRSNRRWRDALRQPCLRRLPVSG